VVQFLLREAVRRADENIAQFNQLSADAQKEMAAQPDEIETECARVIALIEHQDSGQLKADLAKARQRAEVPALQSAETLILAAGAAGALLAFVLRFAEIKIDRNRLVITAKDNELNSGNICTMFGLLQKALPLLGGASASGC